MIQVKNLIKTYTTAGIQTKALNNVSFSINKGEFVAIIGPSGSGKSTLMHILGALDSPTSGSYKLNGTNVESLNNNQLAEIRNKQIGFVFQAYNLLARNSVLNNILLPMKYAGIPKVDQYKKAQQVLKLVDLHDKINNAPNQLSGGQKQRVAIARALVMNPAILLADEPTGNLPTKQSHEILDYFEKLNNQGHTVILITHEDDIAKRAKRIITLVDGKIVSDKQN